LGQQHRRDAIVVFARQTRQPWSPLAWGLLWAVVSLVLGVFIGAWIVVARDLPEEEEKVMTHVVAFGVVILGAAVGAVAFSKRRARLERERPPPP
jgi:uncharacterized membrane protein HdeD (DUF308 family)